MSNWLKILSCTVLLSTGESLIAWSPANAQQDVKPLTPDTPLDADQDWYSKESYLLWLPYEDDMDYANKVSEKGGDPFTINLRLKKPGFEWNSGVRLEVGKYLSQYHLWDVFADVTYFYGNASSHSSPSSSDGEFLVGKWVPTFAFISVIPLNGANQGSVNWKLNFFYEDVSVGRQCSITSMITAHPFIGLRGVQYYENQSSRLSNFIPGNNGAVADITRKMRFSGYNEFWGIGPRFGTDFSFKFSNHWTLLGSISGSFFFGHYKVKEKISLFLFEVLAPNFLGVDFNFRGSDHGYSVRSNLEGSLGLGWEAWVRNHTVRIAPSLMFEASEWFDMNQWLTYKMPTFAGQFALPSSNITGDRRHGDLGLVGVTFNLQIDF